MKDKNNQTIITSIMFSYALVVESSLASYELQTSAFITRRYLFTKNGPGLRKRNEYLKKVKSFNFVTVSHTEMVAVLSWNVPSWSILEFVKETVALGSWLSGALERRKL